MGCAINRRKSPRVYLSQCHCLVNRVTGTLNFQDSSPNVGIAERSALPNRSRLLGFVILSVILFGIVNSPPKDLLDLLKRYNSDVQELALALREIVLDELAPCYENII